MLYDQLGKLGPGLLFSHVILSILVIIRVSPVSFPSQYQTT